MPATVRKRRKGEGGKAWKIVDPSGKVVGESDTKSKAAASARIRTEAHEKKMAGRRK
jgi:hypothetical protein